MIQWMLAIWSLVLLPFLKPAWTPGISQFMYCWSLAWRILSIILLAFEMSTIVWSFEHSLALPFFGIGIKTNLFQSCGHCWVFQTCWNIECSTFTASFRTWNSSAGIPSPPLALFIVMLPKARLNIWNFLVHILLKPGLENFEYYFASVRWLQLCSTLNILWCCLPFGLEWKLTFSSPVATAEFCKTGKRKGKK